MNWNKPRRFFLFICALALFTATASSEERLAESQQKSLVPLKPTANTYYLPLDEIRKSYADHIKSLLVGVKGTLQSQFTNTEYGSSFCAAFFDDFKRQNGIKHIEPTLVTQNREDEQLKDYLSQIDDDPFEGVVGSNIYRALHNFSVYKVDIDNNSENGEEVGFYAEDYRKIYRESSNYGHGYNTYIFYGRSGQFVAGSSHSPHFYSKDNGVKTPSNINGLIEYNHKIFLFDLYSYGNTYQRNPGLLELQVHQKQSHGDKYNLLPVCRFALEKEL